MFQMSLVLVMAQWLARMPLHQEVRVQIPDISFFSQEDQIKYLFASATREQY